MTPLARRKDTHVELRLPDIAGTFSLPLADARAVRDALNAALSQEEAQPERAAPPTLWPEGFWPEFGSDPLHLTGDALEPGDHVHEPGGVYVLLGRGDPGAPASDRLVGFRARTPEGHTEQMTWPRDAKRTVWRPPGSFFEDETRDEAMVRDLAQAMRTKLARARLKGRGGWHDPRACSAWELWQMMVEHAHKDNLDMVDVASFAGMIWQRLRNRPEERTALRAAIQTSQGDTP